MKYLARILLVLGLLGMVLGFVSCRRISGGSLDSTTDLEGIAASQKSLRAIFMGAGVFALGFYLRGRAPDNQTISQLRADLTLIRARFCRRCACGYSTADCRRVKGFGFWRLVCPRCGRSLEWSGSLIALAGMVMLSAFFMPLLNRVFPHVPDFLMAIGVILPLAGIPVFVVGVGRLGR